MLELLGLAAVLASWRHMRCLEEIFAAGGLCGYLSSAEVKTAARPVWPKDRQVPTCQFVVSIAYCWTLSPLTAVVVVVEILKA